MVTRRTVSGCLFVVMILGQLAIVEIKDLRETGSTLADRYGVFGYAPNLIAALTLPCLFLGLALKSRRRDLDAPYGWGCLWREQRAILLSGLTTTTGLLAWEFIQVYRPNRTFDWQDVWATLAGALLFFATIMTGRGLTSVSTTQAPAGALPARSQDAPAQEITP